MVRPSGTFVIDITLDSQFYIAADDGWSPDEKYQISWEDPTAFEEPAAVTADTTFNKLIEVLGAGFDGVEVNREIVQVTAGQRRGSSRGAQSCRSRCRLEATARTNYARTYWTYQFVARQQQLQQPKLGKWADPPFTSTPRQVEHAHACGPPFEYDYTDDAPPQQNKVERAQVLLATDMYVNLIFESDGFGTDSQEARTSSSFAYRTWITSTMTTQRLRCRGSLPIICSRQPSGA